MATAGVDVNGGRAGDPASYVEEKGSFRPLPGTINIFLSMNGFAAAHLTASLDYGHRSENCRSAG